MTTLRNLPAALREIVGRRYVLTTSDATRRYRRGYRASVGTAQAVVRPGTLLELWKVVELLVASDVALIVQAANTGLTGGSTPDARIDRPVVIVSTMRIDAIHAIDGGRQVVCLPGATLHGLERLLRPLGREPHSVIGSSCLGASVIGGVSNNSGGALVQRGPAYTELSLFAQVGADGCLRLVNRLGIDLGDDPATMLERLEAGRFEALPVAGAASDGEYAEHVRAIEAATPARYNADPRRLFDASGNAGRLIVFAVRLDTFPRGSERTTFYIGSNGREELTTLRRALLSLSSGLPVSAEYIHRDAFDVADRYGRDTFVAIRLLGTDRLPRLFALKARVDAAGEALGLRDLSERMSQALGRLLPDHLPARLRHWRARYEHHLILTVGSDTLDEVRPTLARLFPSATGDVFECTPDEADRAGLHRFVMAGAAVRYRSIHAAEVADIVALDVALPRNASDWFGDLPASLERQVVAVLRYGHFLCHVFHRDYLLRHDGDVAAVKSELLAVLDAQGAHYPAEHNVGRQYRAAPALAHFYRTLDPTNRCNPGIGMTPTSPNWAGEAPFEGVTP